MKVSVIMATYNGEKYIYEQLESLRNQTRKIDEVIICDDCSSDNTVEKIRSYINTHNLNNEWKVYVNESNKGYVKNFIEGALISNSDIIFYCDQDDIWDERKIQIMTKKFEENDNVKGLLCSFSCIDENGNNVDKTLNKIRRGKKGDFYKVKFHSQVKNNYCGGLTLAVKREELNILSDVILKNNLSHDVPIGLFLSAKGEFYRLCETLVYRRVHTDNVSEPKYTLKSRLDNIDYHIKGRKTYLNLLKSCYEYYKDKNILNYRDIKDLKLMINDVEKYVYYLENRKVFKLFLNIFKMNRMDNKAIKIVNFICSIYGKYK